MAQALEALEGRLREIQNIRHAIGVLGWDQQTYMPRGGAPARGEQMATLGEIAHAKFISDDIGHLIAEAKEEVTNLPPDDNAASLVRVAERDYQQATRVPPELVAEITRHGAAAYAAWAQARETDDYTLFAPYLQKTIDFSRQVAEYLGYEEQLYDALLDQFEPGMKTSQVQAIFEDLKHDLIPLVHAIVERKDRVDDSVLHQPFDEAKQEAFGMMVAQAFGYDLTRGRQDRTLHPFATSFSRDDVRITTRFDLDFLNPALFGTLHETGHALYEQGIGEDIDGNILGDAGSLGLHESQSRMWENVVGRSRPFWRHFYPQLQERFPQQLGGVDLETFYRAINRVEPTLIRVEADEVTYNLHIMLRFEMELDLLSGTVSVQDAPEVWNSKMKSYLDITPPNNARGILQDVHWSHGMMGYFTTYSLGNILSVQLFDRAVEEQPRILEEIGRGEFGTLRRWLTDYLYQHGRKFTPNELVQRITGEPIQSRSYMAYLKRKFGEIYGL